MFLNDQATRGNLMKDIIFKYDVGSTKIIVRGEIVVKYFALINSVNFRKWIFSIDFL